MLPHNESNKPANVPKCLGNMIGKSTDDL